MGGRTQRPEPRIADRNLWIKEVSNRRLERYSDMLLSGGATVRISGDFRSDRSRVYLADLIDFERWERGGQFNASQAVAGREVVYRPDPGSSRVRFGRVVERSPQVGSRQAVVAVHFSGDATPSTMTDAESRRLLRVVRRS